MRMERVIWLFPIALTLHNLEEAVWLPAWSQHAGFWNLRVNASEFRIAVAVLTFLGFAAAYWAVRSGKQGLGSYVLSGFAFAMLLNVIFHVAATIGLREYAPGVVTAVFINLPVMSYLLLRMFRERWVTWPKLLLALALVPVTIVFMAPGLFFLGRMVSSFLGI
jgi:Protein of unknown function with HXXEE motif